MATQKWEGTWAELAYARTSGIATGDFGQLLANFCPGGGGRDSAYERGGDACRKFWNKPLKETNLGVAQAFFDPWKRPC